MKNFLPGFIFVALILLILGISFYTLKFASEFLEKRSLKVPPPFKKIENIQGVSAGSESAKVKYPHDYTLILLGDSMTETLGNSDELRGYLNEYFPDKTFEVLNYGYGATNILSAKERLTETTHHGGRDYQPISRVDFDYLLIESFGHNPLSEFKKDGLKKQTKALDDLIAFVATTSGREKIIFVGTIGTNKDTYAKTSRELDAKTRIEWAKERDNYIKNHIEYARSHGIPVIDIFTPSLDIFGSSKQYLIRDDDYIHPSPKGVLFISKKIADFLVQNNLIK